MALIADAGSIPATSTIFYMINILSSIKALWQNNNRVKESKTNILDFKPILLTTKTKTKELDMSDQVKTLQSRISTLQDRVALLETELRNTQNKVREDFNKLLNLFEKSSDNRRSSSTYRGP